MRNFQYIFETSKRSFMIAFSICMIVPLRQYIQYFSSAKFHSEEVSSTAIIKNLNLLNKTLQENNTLHLRLFFQRKLRFLLLSYFL